MKKTMILSLFALSIVFFTGCVGNSARSVYERAVFAANATIDLERTADSTRQILNRYERHYSQSQYDSMERDFSSLATSIATDPRLSDADRTRYVIDLYRQYGDQRSRLERELVQDQAKGNMVVNNIRAGGSDIKTLQFAEELESAAERDYSRFVGELIVDSSAEIAYQAEVIVAQKQADEAMQQALANLEASGAEEEFIEEEPPAEDSTPEPAPAPTTPAPTTGGE